jgi:membrane protease YdiL (CAAX protease family)
VFANHTLLFGLLVWFLRMDGQSLRDIGWSTRAESRYWWIEVGMGLVAGGAIFAIQRYLSEPVVAWVHSFVADFRASSGTSVPVNAAGLLAATVFAGIVEESVYRGYAIRRLDARLGVVMAVFVSTLFFMLMHLSLGWTGMTVVFINGLLLALLFVWRRALLGVAIAHACVNVLVLTL